MFLFHPTIAQTIVSHQAKISWRDPDDRWMDR